MVGCRTKKLEGVLAEIGGRAGVEVGMAALSEIGQVYLEFGKDPGLFFPLLLFSIQKQSG